MASKPPDSCAIGATRSPSNPLLTFVAMNVRHPFRLFVFIVLAVTGQVAVFGQDSTLQVMSYNLRLPNPDDGLHYWGNRRSLVTSLIGYHEPDLIGVQEAFRRQINEIITDLSEYGWFGVCRTDGSTNPKPDGEFSAILYRKDRFRLLDGGTFWLSATPDEKGSKGWDAAFPRIVTWAMFKDKNTDRDFFHFNTHFDHQGLQARDESAKLLLQQIETRAGDLPVVITGDFNSTIHDTPYTRITNDADTLHLIDAIAVSENRHHGPRGSFSPTFLISGLQDNRIDYIFIKNNAAVLKHAILTDNWYGKLASDHLPVLAEIIILK